MSDEWGPWIEHDGKGCPCVGMWVEMVRKRGEVKQGIAGANCIAKGLSPDEPGSAWVHILAKGYSGNFVIRYRIRKPRGLTILQTLVASLDAPEGPAKAPRKVKT